MPVIAGVPIESLISFTGIVGILIWVITRQDKQIDRLEVKLDAEKSYNQQLSETVHSSNGRVEQMVNTLTEIVKESLR